jgi:signal transduction histidine kinase/PAS domain-containing protein
MNKKLLTSYPEEAINKIKELLNKSKDMILDENLLNTVENICQGVESNLKKEKPEPAKSLKKSNEDNESKKLEEQIQEERRIFDNIIEVIGIGLCLIDKDLRIKWANHTLWDWLNLKESPVGKYCRDIYHCNEFENGCCPAVTVFKGGKGSIIETWVESKDKKKMCAQHIAIPIRNDKGNIDSVLILTIDSTESEKTVYRLSLLQMLGEVMQGTLHLDKLLHLILTCVTSGYAFGFNRAMLFLINKEHNVLNGKLAVGPSSQEEANQIWKELSMKYSSFKDIIKELDFSHNIDTPFNTMTKLMVYPLSDIKEVVISCVKEKKPIIIQDADNDPRVTEEFKKALRANNFVCVPLIARNEPKGVIVADNIYTGEPISDDLVSILTTFANQAALAIENAETYKRLEYKIDQLTETQQRLIRSEKLAAIGSMSSYITHEIRNPLVTIGGFAKTLSRFTFTDSKIKTNIDIIIEEVKRLEKILNNITDFGKPSTPEKVDTQICKIMEDTCILMENYFNEEHIKLHKQFEVNIPQISVDPAQIKQVFLNVIMNAVESMPDGGDLDVIVKSVYKSIEIDIIDTGKGIPPGVLQNIFDPFFTTKPNGTGVGLSVCLKIIEDHGGNIDVKSKHGKGTRISLSLPVK